MNYLAADEETVACLHLRRDRLLRAAALVERPLVAARDDAGRAVGFGEVRRGNEEVDL